ncbi:MAG: hypothetical protein AB7S36_23130, partial [Planctomycetota bacterium]
MSIGADTSWDEDDPAMSLGTVSVTDDNANFNGGSLSVSVTSGGAATDQFFIVDGNGIVCLGYGGGIGERVYFNGTLMGTFSAHGGDGTALTVSLNAQATPARVQTLLGQVRYMRAGATAGAAITITATVNDGSDGSSNDSMDVTITADNDAQSISLAAGMALDENDAPTILDPAAVFRDDATADYDGGTLTVSIQGGEVAGDRLYVKRGGLILVWGNEVRFRNQPIAWMTSYGQGASLDFDLSSAYSTPFAIECMLRQLTYENLDESPASTRTLDISVTEPTPNNVSDSIVVTINPTNDAPRLRNGARTVRMLFIGNS